MVSVHLPVALQSRLKTTPDQISTFCQRWQVAEIGLFGSVLRDDFRPSSDVDVLISFNPDADTRWNLFDLIKMQHELEGLFERPVDLTERSSCN